MRPIARGVPPSPEDVRCVDELVRRLRELRAWAGVSEREVHRRVRRAWAARGIVELPVFDTVRRCFSLGRKRVDEDLVAEIAAVLGGDRAGWRRALQGVASGQSTESPLSRHIEQRLLGHYWQLAEAAMAGYAPYERRDRPASPAPVFASRADATAWLDAECATLVAVAGSRSAELSDLLAPYLEGRCRYREAETLHARVARSSSPRTRANALRRLSVVQWKTGRYQAALGQLREALALFRAGDDRAGEGKTLNNLGSVFRRLGRHHEASHSYPRSIAIARRTADPDAEANARNCLGILRARLGDYGGAEEQQRLALDLFRDIGNRSGVSRVWSDLGEVLMRTERHDAALRCFPLATASAEEVGDRVGLGLALAREGLARARLDDCGAAMGRLGTAQRIATETGDCGLSLEVLHGLGVTRRRMGLADEALGHHRAALSMADGLGARHERNQARAAIARLELLKAGPH